MLFCSAASPVCRTTELPLLATQLAGRGPDGATGMAAATATLVLSASQVGCILGRGGVNITHIRQVRAFCLWPAWESAEHPGRLEPGQVPQERTFQGDWKLLGCGRQVSGAHVRLNEARAGESERVLEMGGALEQVQSAQNLVQVRHACPTFALQYPCNAARRRRLFVFPIPGLCACSPNNMTWARPRY